MMLRKANFIRQFLFSARIFPILLLLAVFGVGSSVYKVLAEKRVINEKISEIEREIQKLEKSNQELVGDLEYLGTDWYLEREAKEKLNLQRVGEKVIIINRKDRTASEKIVDLDDSAAAVGKSNVGWWGKIKNMFR